jgi:hypothetical protein
VTATTLLQNCTFEGIQAGFVAIGGTHIGGIFRNNTSSFVVQNATLINSLVAGNMVRLHISPPYSAVGDSTVINSTIIENVGEEWRPHTAPGVSGGTVVNSIVWGNCFQSGPCDQSAQIWLSDVSYSLVQGWTQGGEGNFSAHPRFADSWGRLSPTSPAIDAGNNLALPAGVAVDLDDLPRFRDDPGMPDRGVPGGAGGSAIVDLGAFEFQGTSCYGNCDGSTIPPILNVADFACFINRYAEGDPYANCDGSTMPPILNVEDFTCFINAFAAGCP